MAGVANINRFSIKKQVWTIVTVGTKDEVKIGQ